MWTLIDTGSDRILLGIVSWVAGSVDDGRYQQPSTVGNILPLRQLGPYPQGVMAGSQKGVPYKISPPVARAPDQGAWIVWLSKRLVIKVNVNRKGDDSLEAWGCRFR